MPVQLHGLYAALAVLVCALPLLLGFAMPAITLLNMSFHGGDPLVGGRFFDYARNSAILASLAAAITVAAALIVAYGVRLKPSALTRGASRVAAMGIFRSGSSAFPKIPIP